MLKKVVILGPESTGKSMLSEQLARHYNTLWVPEYAREYLLAHGNKYSYETLLDIAKGQIQMDDEFVERVRKSGLLFIDTDMYVMKVWCEFVFEKTHRWILDQIVERKYDLYLLCQPDLPWTADEFREYPNQSDRDRLYLIYKDLMINQSVPWVEIGGDYEQRLQRSISAVNDLLLK